jgi:RimJ/RimL family protein N-acetyltransferase
MQMRQDEIHQQPLPAPPTNNSITTPATLAAIFDEVETERLVLRRLQPGDGPAMFIVHGDPATNQYNPAGPHRNLATSERTLQRWLQHWEMYGFGYWAVKLVQTQEIIGFGGVKHFIWRNRDVLNLYYRITPAAWGQGYATELAKTALTLAREYLPQWPVIARIRPQNTASMRIAEHIGLLRRPDLDTEQHLVFMPGWTY